MARLFPRLLILCSLLVNGLGVASLAHAHDAGSGHVIEHAASLIDAVESSEEKTDPRTGLPDHAAPHHHCLADVSPSNAALDDAPCGSSLRFQPAVSAAMVSRAVAPPIEPPAA